MNSKENMGFFSQLKYDLPSSLVVFLVALPLCLGIALASGAPLFSGVIAGIVGGTVVALMSKSQLGVSGPAAGLAVIVLTSIQDLGSFELFLVAVIIGGVIQIVLGFLKAGVIGYYFPNAVIKGMLSGIGIIIILKQIPHAFGYDVDPEGDFAFQQVDGKSTFGEILSMFDHITTGAVIITVVSMAILILWETAFIKKISLLSLIPGPLLAVVAGILLKISFEGNALLDLSQDHLVTIPVAGSITGFFNQFTFPDFSQMGNSELYVVAITIAIVASLETLLSVEATDKLDPQKRITPTNRELIAQGTGNIVSGFIGGLPITQVIVRSSANVQSGGKTRASAFIHGLLLLGSAIAIPKVLNLIPLSSLAAILFMVGYKLAKPALFKEMYAKGKSQFIPFMATILGIAFIDLLMGIAFGMVVAILHILWNNYKTPYHFEQDGYNKGEKITIKLSEDVSFLNKASILRTLNKLPDDTHLIIDASKTKTIHPDIIDIIEDFRENAASRNIQIELNGMHEMEKHDPVEKFGHLVLDEPIKSSRKKMAVEEV